MATSYDHYLENEILHADPVKLVGILYRAAIEAVAAARVHVRNREIRERSQRITKASEIIRQLMFSLDHSAGGQLSRNLVELYAYMQTRLIQANSKQIEAPLLEVENLLTTLLDAWAAVHPSKAAQPADQAAYEPLSCTY